MASDEHVEGNLRLTFSRPAEKLDRQEVATPHGMSLADFVVDEGAYTMILEVKDPSDPNIPSQHSSESRCAFRRDIVNQTLIHERLVPTARDTYTFLHLMGRDAKPMLFVVLLGLDAYPDEPALLMGFKDRLVARLRQEGENPWVREYVSDAVVITLKTWPSRFPQHSVSRV